MNTFNDRMQRLWVMQRLFRTWIIVALFAGSIFTFQPAGAASAASFGSGSNSPISSVFGQSPVLSVTKTNSVTALLYTIPGSPVVGDTVEFKFSVTASPPDSGTPTGTIEVLQDGITLLCTATLPVGTCSYSFTVAGTFVLDFNYSGDANFNASTASQTLDIQTSISSTSLLPDTPSPIFYGQPISFLAIVYPAVTTGTVSFEDSGIVIPGCESVALFIDQSINVAICTPTPPGLAVGAHSISAFYNGDNTYSYGFSNSLAYEVIKANTTTSFTGLNPASQVVGQSVAFHFAVTTDPPSEQ